MPRSKKGSVNRRGFLKGAAAGAAALVAQPSVGRPEPAQGAQAASDAAGKTADFASKALDATKDAAKKAEFAADQAADAAKKKAT